MYEDHEAHEDGVPAGTSEFAQQPMPNPLSRSTLAGCLGILLVLALPVLLFLPVDQWHMAPWVQLDIPMVAFGLAACGAWVLWRMPSAAPMRSHDPLHPLTVAGRHPVVEWPATARNRVAFWIVGGFALCGLVGFIVTTVAVTRQHDLLLGSLITGGAGAALSVHGFLVGSGRAAIPALRWVRIPVQGGLGRHGAPLMLAGLVGLAWSLWVGASAGYIWGAGGLALLVLGSVLVAPLGRQGRPYGRPRMPSMPPRSTEHPPSDWRT